MSQSPSPGLIGVTRRNPPTLWNMAADGFSQISVAAPGHLAFLSGQIASPAGGAPVPPDLASQARLATAALAAALAELDATAADIVMLRLYVVDASTERFGQVLAELRGLLGAEMPSVTALGISALFTPALQVEIEMVVRLP